MIKVTLIDSMGTDLTVVDAARVSFDKESDWEWPEDIDGYSDPGLGGPWLREADTKLIHYLAKHQHWSPFAHPQISFRVAAPIFVARQLQKHTVGLAWNEVSRRYVDTAPTFYSPETWRKRAESVKQGSADEAVYNKMRFNYGDGDFDYLEVDEVYTNAIAHLKNIYNQMLKHGVCPEQARMLLPQSMMTEWIWTGSLYAFARVCKLRLDSHTQKETRDVANQISDPMAGLFPVSWAALLGGVPTAA